MRPADSFVEQPIRSLQTMLRVLALDDPRMPQVVPDGIYGPLTTQAISVFQRMQELPVTGVTDHATWKQLVIAYEEAVVRVEQAEPLTVLMPPGAVYTASDRGPYIFVLQAMLAYLSRVYPAIPAPGTDGSMDPETVKSLTAFQSLCGLDPTGELNRISWKNAVLQFTLCAHHQERTG